MDKNLLELYTDCLISSFGQTTATSLSRLLDNAVSHDKITRFLSSSDFNSIQLWSLVKPTIRSIESENGVLIIDDTIQEKPHTKENEIVSWHFDHSKNRTVKGVNILNCLYHIDEVNIPVAFEINARLFQTSYQKTNTYQDSKTNKEKRKSDISKNELMRNMIKVCKRNKLNYKYVLADSWFLTLICSKTKFLQRRNF